MNFFTKALTHKIVLGSRSKNIVTILLFFIFYCSVTNGQSRIYLSNDDHTDYMFSADEKGYDTLFVKMIDSWMANNNATNASLPDYQTKFNCDGTYWAWVYAKHKTAAQFQAFMNQVKSERIVISANPLINTYGCVPAEATVRGMYYAGELKKKYAVPFDMAMAMENQVLPLGLASLWKGCGVKYAWHGVCNCSTKVPNLLNARQKEIYWYKGLDDQAVLLKWYTKTADHTLGNYSESKNPPIAINDLTAKVNTPAYNYNIAGAFGVGGDDLQTLTDKLAPIAKSSSNASRRIIVSNEVDFFRDFETNYGASLPSLTQTYGTEWEHGCASLSEVSAKVKRSLEKLRSAEAMATVVSRTNPTFASTLDSMRREAWMSIGIYWEHNFEGNGPAVSNALRAAWQKKIQQSFTRYVDQLYTLALSKLAGQIIKVSSNQRFFVFNPLSWIRTDYSDIAYSGTLPVHVRDVTLNVDVPSQVINKDGIQYLRILATGVPSVGYKIFEIQSGAGSVFPNTGTLNATTHTLDNDYFTIVFTSNGVITSLIDKAHSNKQLVNSAGSSDYINNLGRNTTFESNSNTGGTFVLDNSGPVSITVKFTSTSLVNHQTVMTVYKGIPRIDIDNKITKNFGSDFLYNTFSFNNTSISSPTIWHEENGAVIHAKKVSTGGHYADVQSRYDWLTLNHFAAVSSNGNYGVTLSNQDCYFMQTGNSTIQALDENTARIKVLVGGRVDGLGMLSQDNDTVFNQRYSISAYNTYSAASSMKSALEHQDGFVAAFITNTAGSLPASNFSFMSISSSNILLWALKPAEEGMSVNGAIVRVWNLANSALSANFVLKDSIADAKNITHIETDISAATFSNKTLSASMGRNQMKSYRVKLKVTAARVQLTAFKGTRENAINKLSWQAEAATNLDHYIIERFSEGNIFNAIATIYGTGNTLYNFPDSSINKLKADYYRLRLVEEDGNISYSDIIQVGADHSINDLLLYPNPVQNQLKFQLVLDKPSRCDVWITDITGKNLLKLPASLFKAGNNYSSINISNLPKQTYVLIVQDAGKKYVRQFIKN
ncbi:MAG: T9SS type A sorting domain-containing protein [Ginsengibacter sp.]